MFPARIPGVALLLLRGTVAAELMIFVWCGNESAPARLRVGIAALACLLLCLGLLTPICSIIGATLQAITLGEQWKGQSPALLFWVPIFLCVGMLGPGAFSIDARLFGRKIIRPSVADDTP